MALARESYARHTAHALRLLARFGGLATITRETQEEDPDYVYYPGAPDPETVTTTTVHDVTVLETRGADGESRDLIQSSEFVGLLACADDFVPTSADRIVMGGKSYAISEATAVQPAPGGRTIVYELVATT